MPLDQVAAFEKLLAAAPFPSRGEIEKGMHHGYAFSDRDNFNEAAREKHYERMLALHRRHIGQAVVVASLGTAKGGTLC